MMAITEPFSLRFEEHGGTSSRVRTQRDLTRMGISTHVQPLEPLMPNGVFSFLSFCPAVCITFSGGVPFEGQ